jgi:hypothetical protein
VTTPNILVASWQDGLFAVTGDRRTHEIAGQSVRGLVANGRGGAGGALAIVGGHQLQARSPDGGWTTLATSELELSCSMAVGQTIYVGTDDARILQLSAAERVLVPLEGFDRVPGRETWYAGSAIVNGQRVGPPLGIRSVTANADGSVLFANVHVGGIPRSLDGGATWEPTIDIHTDVHEVRAHPTRAGLVAAAASAGLCLSRDAGATWTIESDGLHDPHCYAVTFCGDELFISAAVDPFVAQGRVYRRPLEAQGPLLAVAGGMPMWTEGKVDTGCIAVRGAFLAMADQGGNLYCSQDFGQNWTCRITGLPAPSGVIIL